MNNIHASYVYCMLNIHTGNRYVGSTTNFTSRKAKWLYDLRNKRCRSKLLQMEFDKYGEDSIKFFVIEKIFTFEKEELFVAEQRWIDKYKPEYNINELAGNHFHKSAFTPEAKKKSVDKRRGRKQPQSEIENRRQSLIRHYSDPANHKTISEERKKHLSEINTGERNPNWGTKRPKEFGDMIRNLFSSVQYTFVSPEGKEITFKNLVQNGEKMTGLPYWQLRQLYRGKKKEHGGWTFKEKIYVGYKKER